ncbi:fatty acid desaturase [Neiella marina]|uniref:Fatty acid desaturase n=1 Tax=Neiella holothuriorum TaxID=2870530 RepID=A0ABS7EG00_9GAMM|nr:fatty acid desaturase [Neiella holothuriorum]MBW8191271.1 fatty acid desaturase [Neiella holothuriorum]
MAKPAIIWSTNILFASTFIGAITLVPWYGLTYGYSAELWLIAALCLGYCGMSITVGYHRLWSHKTFDAHPFVRFILAIGGAFALQNSALHWSSDHRVHHRHVDSEEKDPYAATKGFWYSHIGWMLREYQPLRYQDYSNCRDLQKDNIVMWQHRNYWWLTWLLNLGVPLAFGWLCGDVVGGFLLIGVLRLVASHHFTFFINSLAHIWGKRTYTEKNSARDNGWLALLTYGEGYHNFHHLFEYDYRNGIRWYQFDPSKWFIWGMSKFGLTQNLRKAPTERILKAKLETQKKRLDLKMELSLHAERWRESLQHEYDLLLQRIQEFYALRKQLLQLKKDKLSATYQQERDELKSRIEQLKASIQQHQQRWQQLAAEVTALSPA